MPPRPPSFVEHASAQIDLFPEPLHVEALDPRRVGGDQTRVTGVYLVKRGAMGAPHRIFHDRYGWYCEQHGRACPLVGEARRALGAADASGGVDGHR